MMRRRLGALLLCAVSLLGLGLHPTRAAPLPRPFIPSFWNPDSPPEKPDIAGIGAIRFVTTGDYPPFGFVLANGMAAGFEVDLARALCEELQVRCTMQARAWDEILPALARSDADAAIASVAITDEARRTVAFTRPYFKTPARFVGRQGSVPPGDPAAWSGTRVGVVADTAHQAYLQRFFPKLTVVPYPGLEPARAALKGGAVEALFGDAVASANWLNGSDAGGCCAFAGGPYTDEAFFGHGAGIAVRKEDVALRRALDYALARVAAKGTYGDIYLRYFPVGIY